MFSVAEGSKRERSEIRQDIEGHGNDFSFHPG